MKKWFMFVLLLFIFYCIFEFIVIKFSPNYEFEYDVISSDSKYHVKEKFISLKNNNNYELYITLDGINYNFQIYSNKLNRKKIIKEINNVKSDSYTCIYPVFEDKKQYTDIICNKSNIQYLYNQIKNTDSIIDEFANSMVNKGYSLNNYQNNGTSENKNLYSWYKNNVSEEKFLLLTYKGVSIFENNQVSDVDLFKKDVYNSSIKATINNYFIIANYNQNHEYDSFYIVDINSKNLSVLKMPFTISFDCSVEGVVDNELYIYDKDAKIQYKINPKKKSVQIFGNQSRGFKVYVNGNWHDYALKDMVDSNIIFSEEDISFDDYKYITSVGTDKFGYNYFYKQKNNKYEIYRISKIYDVITYVTTLDYIDDLTFSLETIYYKTNNGVGLYNDLYGKKVLLESEEFKFNKGLYYSVYR